jgi:hypothetical protein
VKKLYFILLLCIAFGFTKNEKEKDWQLKKFENGIAVYTRLATNSNYKELRSVFQIKTTLSSFLAVLGDFESYPEWVYRCGKSKTLKKISNTEFMHYQTVNAPWPVDSRDIVIHIKIKQDPITKTVIQNANGAADSLAEVKDFVRIKVFHATWTLVPEKGGIINAEYRLLVEPGGNIPAWLVNMAVVEGPYETNVKLKERIFEDKYQKAKLPHIKELE